MDRSGRWLLFLGTLNDTIFDCCVYVKNADLNINILMMLCTLCTKMVGDTSIFICTIYQNKQKLNCNFLNTGSFFPKFVIQQCSAVGKRFLYESASHEFKSRCGF